MLIINRKVEFDYKKLESFTAGIVLYGTEVKSIRLGNVNLKDTFCYFDNNELFSNFNISEYKFGNIRNHDPERPKKLLLKKKELNYLFKKISTRGVTIVPHKLFLQKGLIKMELWLATGKRDYDKRNSIKEKDISRDLARTLETQ